VQSPRHAARGKIQAENRTGRDMFKCRARCRSKTGRRQHAARCTAAENGGCLTPSPGTQRRPPPALSRQPARFRKKFKAVVRSSRRQAMARHMEMFAAHNTPRPRPPNSRPEKWQKCRTVENAQSRRRNVRRKGEEERPHAAPVGEQPPGWRSSAPCRQKCSRHACSRQKGQRGSGCSGSSAPRRGSRAVKVAPFRRAVKQAPARQAAPPPPPCALFLRARMPPPRGGRRPETCRVTVLPKPSHGLLSPRLPTKAETGARRQLPGT